MSEPDISEEAVEVLGVYVARVKELESQLAALREAANELLAVLGQRDTPGRRTRLLNAMAKLQAALAAGKEQR